ncbi:hypothetical protein J6A31_08070 [bacterium]|nr:hypothetical protein [bacterium]
MTFVQNQGNQQVQGLQQVKPINQQQVPQIVQPQPLVAPPYTTNPQTQAPITPSYAGVNIQIYNPSVGIPNINPTGSMTNSQAIPGMAYPSNYYTQQFATPQTGAGFNSGNGYQNQYANGQLPNGNGQYASAPGGIIAQGGAGGSANIYNTIQTPTPNNGQTSNTNELNDKNLPTNASAETAKALANNNNTDNTANASQDSTTSINKLIEEANKLEEKKKTEKRKVVELTDEYIMNLENYLNSKDKDVRMMGAKEVIARLQEDNSRKDDPALTALINKMLQDPDQKIRFLALSMLEARTCTGNDYTVGVLQKMQQGTSGFGQDAAQATSVLLKMSGKVVEKEFEVPENSQKK